MVCLQINVIYFWVHILIQKLAIDNDNIASSNSEELLGVVIDSEVKFSRHIENLCRCRIFGVEFGVESISTLSANIWVLVPENMRQSTSFNSFKQGISSNNV